jgi:hypothetical protein
VAFLPESNIGYGMILDTGDIMRFDTDTLTPMAGIIDAFGFGGAAFLSITSFPY